MQTDATLLANNAQQCCGGGLWRVAKTAKPQQNAPKTAKPCPKSLKIETAIIHSSKSETLYFYMYIWMRDAFWSCVIDICQLPAMFKAISV